MELEKKLAATRSDFTAVCPSVCVLVNRIIQNMVDDRKTKTLPIDVIIIIISCSSSSIVLVVFVIKNTQSIAGESIAFGRGHSLPRRRALSNTFKSVTRAHCHLANGTESQNGHRQTDGRTDGPQNRFTPPYRNGKAGS